MYYVKVMPAPLECGGHGNTSQTNQYYQTKTVCRLYNQQFLEVMQHTKYEIGNSNSLPNYCNRLVKQRDVKRIVLLVDKVAYLKVSVCLIIELTNGT